MRITMTPKLLNTHIYMFRSNINKKHKQERYETGVYLQLFTFTYTHALIIMTPKLLNTHIYMFTLNIKLKQLTELN
jgi:hypothetical protein